MQVKSIYLTFLPVIFINDLLYYDNGPKHIYVIYYWSLDKIKRAEFSEESSLLVSHSWKSHFWIPERISYLYDYFLVESNVDFNIVCAKMSLIRRASQSRYGLISPLVSSASLNRYAMFPQMSSQLGARKVPFTNAYVYGVKRPVKSRKTNRRPLPPVFLQDMVQFPRFHSGGGRGTYDGSSESSFAWFDYSND